MPRGTRAVLRAKCKDLSFVFFSDNAQPEFRDVPLSAGESVVNCILREFNEEGWKLYFEVYKKNGGSERRSYSLSADTSIKLTSSAVYASEGMTRVKIEGSPLVLLNLRNPEYAAGRRVITSKPKDGLQVWIETVQ